jgi:hypothetical protein
LYSLLLWGKIKKPEVFPYATFISKRSQCLWNSNQRSHLHARIFILTEKLQTVTSKGCVYIKYFSVMAKGFISFFGSVPLWKTFIVKESVAFFRRKIEKITFMKFFLFFSEKNGVRERVFFLYIYYIILYIQYIYVYNTIYYIILYTYIHVYIQYIYNII